MAVYCPDPSVATVMTDLGPVKVAEEVVRGVDDAKERLVVLKVAFNALL
jgi:hypothetical protein